MTIQIYGFGCPSCQKLFNLTREAISETKKDIELEYITDVEKIMAKDFRSFPVLAIDEKVIFSGKIPRKNELKEIILNYV